MRSLLTILFLSVLLPAFSQQGNFDYLQAYRRFTLANRSVKGISNDPAMLAASADSLVTQYALKGYLYNVGIGIKGLQHQLLGAKSDSTGLVEYLEPLVEGSFVTTDDELASAKLQFIADQVNAIYDLRTGQVWTADNAGNYSIDTSKNYFTTYGVRRFLYNPLSAKTIFVKADSTFDVLNSVGIMGEFDPLFNQSVAANIHQTDVDRWNSKMDSAFVVGSDTIYYDGRDFYNQGTYSSPLRVYRYDNHYIDSLFALVQQGGGAGGTVNNYYGYNLPYNGDSTYYLGGDTLPHKLPITGANPIKLTTNGQNGPATLSNDTLNIPNYFFANNPGDSIDYSFSSMTTIYNEYGPGEYAISGHGVTTNPNNFNYPFRQLKALDVGGWSSGDYVSFTNSTTANATAYTFLRGFIKLKQAVPVEQSISFAFYLNGTLVSKVLSAVNYGLNKGRTDIYSNITIPMSAFGFTSNSFDEIRLIFGGGSSPDGLYLDLLQFQNAAEKENTYVSDLYRIPGTTTVEKVIGGQNVFAYNDSVGVAVDTIPLHNQLLQQLAAIQNNTANILLKLNISDTASMLSPYLKSADTLNKWMPRSMPIVNSFNGRSGSVLPQLSDYSAYYAALNHTHAESDVTNLVSDLAGKEPAIASGTTLQYWRGDKTWQTLNAGRFGIEDNTSTQSRTFNTGGFQFDITNSSTGKYATYTMYSDQGGFNSSVHADVGSDGASTTASSYVLPNYASMEATGPVSGVSNTNMFQVNKTQMFFRRDIPAGSVYLNVSIPPTVGTYYTPISVNGVMADATGNVTIAAGGSSYTDAQARAAISLTTTGTSGAATYNSSTGVLNVPNYAGGGSSGWNLGGNTLTNSGTQYLGTNNNTSLRFKVNGAEILRLDSAYGYAYFTNSLYVGTGQAIRANTASNGQLYIDASNALTGTIYLRSTTVNYQGSSQAQLGNMQGTGEVNMGSFGNRAGYKLVSNAVLNTTVDGTSLTFNDNAVYTKVGMRGVNYQLNDVGTSPSTWTYNNSAVMDIQSTTRGFATPRMTKAQRNAITSPIQGLMVFVTDNGGYLSWYNAGWQKVNSISDP